MGARGRADGAAGRPGGRGRARLPPQDGHAGPRARRAARRAGPLCRAARPVCAGRDGHPARRCRRRMELAGGQGAGRRGARLSL
eukprot:3082875-Prymnesium_polylepis.1